MIYDHDIMKIAGNMDVVQGVVERTGAMGKTIPYISGTLIII